MKNYRPLPKLNHASPYASARTISATGAPASGIAATGAVTSRFRDNSATVRALADSFAPIELAEMQSVALLDRQETKFVFNMTVLHAVLCQVLLEAQDGAPADADTQYRALVVAGEPLNRYRTLYFDTPALDFYHRHLTGAPTRTKVRSREYVESSTAFLEVKRRTKRKRTVKRRMATDGVLTSLHGEYAGFVASEIADTFAPDTFAPDTEALQPVLWNQYQRLTLVNVRRQERVTIDLGLRFVGAGLIDPEQEAALAGIVIAEVKQPRVDRTSPFIELLRAATVRPSPFSKYCMGVSTLLPAVRRHKLNKVHRLVARWQRAVFN